MIRSERDWRLELSASSVLFDGNERDEELLNLAAYLSNNDLRRHAAAYVFGRQVDAEDYQTHFGVRAYGDWVAHNRSWLEAAAMVGESGGTDLEGFGFDVGTTWSPAGDSLPNFTLGYAFGSGDDDLSDGDNGNFRQTGLQDNNDKFLGVTSFRYYGELVDPELSNLGILTVGIGGRPTRASSIDLVFHKYDQIEAFAGLTNTDLRRTPDGIHEDLGWEVDLIYGNRASRNWHVEAVLGYFEPGDAFPGADPALLARLQLRFKF